MTSLNPSDRNAEKYPGTVTEYGIFVRQAGTHDPNGWRRLGRPSTEHETIRGLLMPDSYLDANLKGQSWIEDGMEYKIMERVVTRGEWRNESKDKG